MLPETATDSGTAPVLQGRLGICAHGLKDNAGFDSAVGPHSGTHNPEGRVTVVLPPLSLHAMLTIKLLTLVPSPGCTQEPL